MKKLDLHKLRFWLFTTLLVTAPLSKYPSIASPLYNFSSFRIGFYPVLSLLFVLCTFPFSLKSLSKLYQQSRTSILSIAVLVFVSLMGLTTAIYKARSILLVLSVLMLLCLLVSAWSYIKSELSPNKYPQLVKAVLIAGCVYGVVSVLQFSFAGFGHESFGLLCSGCNSQVFGFPRISGFAAEPQFHANALLIYYFIGLGVFYSSRSRLALSSAVLSLIGIGLTFSRGAYLAAGLSSVLFFILLRLQKLVQIKTVALHFGILVVAVFIVAGLFIASSSYRYRSTPDIAYKTFRSMVQQASLNVIKLPESKSTIGFMPSGLVQASGQERIGAANLAIKAWNFNFRTRVFGVGLGNLGPFTIQNISANVPENLTVYIYYILVLSELGIVGLFALLSMFAGTLKGFMKRFWNSKNAAVYSGIFCLGIAFLIQYCFFGSYINVPYIWLWFGIILGLSPKVRNSATLEI
ncbi:MAG: hypothetical protein JWO47_944 [Candidatus Saccharibacteria bacterium]|nr:hypothetical protein [Candidatus Saccharibacteria bacterium]